MGMILWSVSFFLLFFLSIYNLQGALWDYWVDFGWDGLVFLYGYPICVCVWCVYFMFVFLEFFLSFWRLYGWMGLVVDYLI